MAFDISSIAAYVTNFIQGTGNMASTAGSFVTPDFPILGALVVVVFLLYFMKNNIASWWMLAIIAALILIGSKIAGA